jgi:hypothetical protein
MSNILRPHPLAALFPELPPEELAGLARDIKERGQLEPIILHKGLILDGRNRYRACQIAGVKPQTEEFNQKATRRNPDEFVLSRNLTRRHLSLGQKAAIALEWSERIELSPDPEKNRGRGRPKGALAEAAKNIGVNEQRVFEVRRIRDADPTLYRKVSPSALWFVRSCALSAAWASCIHFTPLSATDQKSFDSALAVFGALGAPSQKGNWPHQLEITRPENPFPLDYCASTSIVPSPIPQSQFNFCRPESRRRNCALCFHLKESQMEDVNLVTVRRWLTNVG